MKFLIDTNVLSEFFKPEPREAILDWFRSTDEEIRYISVLSIGELQRGMERMPQSRSCEALRDWIGRLVTDYADRMLSFDLETAIVWATMRAELERDGRTMPIIDGLIAATAIERGLTVVTRDVRAFQHSGAPVFDPFKT